MREVSTAILAVLLLAFTQLEVQFVVPRRETSRTLQVGQPLVFTVTMVD